MAEALPLGVLLADGKDRLVFANQHLREMWRLPDALLAPGELAPLAAHLAGMIAQPADFALWDETRPSACVELRLGNGRILEQTTCRLMEEAGGTRGWMVTFRDVSQLTLALEELQSSRERLDLAVTGADEGIWDWNLKTDAVYHSPSWFRLLQLQSYSLPGHLESWRRSVHPDDLSDLDQVVTRHRTGGDALFCHRHRLRGGEGRWIWVEAKGKLLPGTDGRPPHMVGTLIDIDHQKRAEEALRESENRFRVLLEGSIQAICIHRAFRPLFVNPAFLRIYGFDSVEQALAIPDLRVLAVEHERAEAERLWQTSLADPGHTAVLQARNVTRQGANIWVEVMLRTIECKGATAQQLTIIGICERNRFGAELPESKAVLQRQAEELAVLATDLDRAREEAERLSRTAQAANLAKSHFLATMSHELRTPLNAIRGFSEIIAEQTFGSSSVPQYSEYAQDINNSGQHLLALINDILDIAKIEAGKLDIVPEYLLVGDVLDSCYRLTRVRAEERCVALTLQVSSSANLLYVDERAVKQIVFNLLSNAIKFTPPGGSVTLSAQIRADGGLTLSVADTGIGIPEDCLQRVMKPFEQINNNYNRNVGGTGLGLTLVKALTELHGGQVRIESARDHGTTVSLDFPSETAQRSGPSLRGAIA